MRGFILACLLALCASAAQGAGRVFYDGFESGNTSLWNQDDYRNRCSVQVANTGDTPPSVAGVYVARCNADGSLLWNNPAAYETLKIPGFSMNNEVFYRLRLRFHANHDFTSTSSRKFFRIYQSGVDILHETKGSPGLFFDAGINGTQVNYWGNLGPQMHDSTSWHMVRYYINRATGQMKIWHDNILVKDHNYGPIATVGFGSTGQFYLISNWADAHDASNYIYVDEVEVFSDTGTGMVSGSLSGGDAVQGSGTGIAPTVQSVACTPTLNQAPASASCTASAIGDSPITWAWTQEGSNCAWSNAAVQSPSLTCQYGGGRAPCARATNTFGTHQLCMSTNSVIWRVVKPSGLTAQ